ncbi:transglutaminaseTgpA domain-containing protein [Alteromonas facilis]|uniref:transglutaminase family protein n=1 Tax=Alteromonas facilis TaxID=2048004 RepID=UPI000C2946A6|nr:DUF3488 and transglutaminase-like domain-containing protein [Alteromonas facilis]
MMLLANSVTMSPQRLERSLCMLLLATAYALITATLFTPLLIWISILAGCVTVMRYVLFFRHAHQPMSMRSINLLAVLAAIALAWFSLSLGLLLTMVNLLVMACAFKLMRINNDKDIRQLAATLLFLTGCGFIFEQGIVHSIIYFSITLLILVALFSYNAPSVRLSSNLRSTGLLVGQALPIAVLLFLVLPQLPPLWQMPTGKGAKTGLSDSVTAGDFAELSQSTELAFRAIFPDTPPSNFYRYWRVMTLENFDGKTWSVSPSRRQLNQQYQQVGHAFSPVLEGDFFDYEIIAEPSHQRWLFSLDIPKATTSNDISIRHGHEYQLIASRPLVSPFSYQVQSYYTMPLNQTLASVDSRINLLVPKTGNPQTREWVAEQRKLYPDDMAFIENMRQYFLDQNFRYTLKPQPMPNDPVDRFLFDHKAGFCAHYASAFAYTLRLAGIPARMVTGYQGGEELTPNVISVHQYDAHAWVEAWLDERGWLRIDPTAWVSPGRIDFGLEHAMRDEGSFLEDSPLSLARLKNIEMFNQIRMWFAQLDYQWSKWILGFDSKQQYDLLKQLFGELTASKLSAIGVGVVLFIAFLMLLYILPQLRNRPKNPIADEYRRSCELVELLTRDQRNMRGANDYLNDIRTRLPRDVRQLFADITYAYVQNQYKSRQTEDDRSVCQGLKLKRKRLARAVKKYA